MGVTGLQRYLETQCREAIVPVDIKEMARDYHSRNKKDPVIVVDGMACVRKIYGSELPWIYGGQWREYIENLSTLVHAFEEVNIKLVFIFDGCVVGDKRPVWISRRKQDVQKVKTIFDIIKRTGKQPNAEHFQIPANLASLTSFVLKYKCGSEVHLTLEDADKVIFDFAESNNCFAIFSQDTDFLIYNTVPYLSINELDVGTLKTVMYDRNILAQKLGLKIHHLPIFSSLVGNDLISVRDLRPFHQWLISDYSYGGDRGIQAILSVALYINQIMSNRELKDVIRRIAWDVFREPYKEEILWTSINNYCKKLSASVGPSSTTTCVTLETLQLAYDRHVNCDNQPIIYNTLRGFEYYSSTLLEYDSRQDIPSCCAIIQPIRQRLYGLILGVTKWSINQIKNDFDYSECDGRPPYKKAQIEMPSSSRFYHKSSQSQFSQRDLKLGVNAVREWCVGPDNPNIESNIVAAIPLDLNSDSANLNNLWSPYCDINLQWQAFLSCVYCSDISLKEIQKIKPQYVLPIILLHYLYSRPSGSLLLDYEIDAFLSHTLTLPTASEIKKIHVEEVDARAVKLAALFIRGASVMLGALGACNYPILHKDALPWNYFDGKFFHYKYLLAKRGATVDILCDNKAHILEEFYFLRQFIVSNSAKNK